MVCIALGCSPNLGRRLGACRFRSDPLRLRLDRRYTGRTTLGTALCHAAAAANAAAPSLERLVGPPIPTQGLNAFRAILAAVTLAFFGCAAPHASAPEAPAWEPGLSISAVASPYGGEVAITYRFVDVPLPPRLRVAFPDRWAGRSGLGDDIVDIRASGPDGPLSLWRDDGGVVAIDVRDAREVELTYTVRPTRRILTHASRFRALGSADRFYAPGIAMLAIPLDLGDAVERSVRFTSSNDAMWSVRATVDTADRLPMRDLLDAAFFAGRFDRVDRARGDAQVTLWIESSLETGGHALADLALRVVEAQSSLLGPQIAAHSRVVVLRREDDEEALNGSGRAGGFMLELGPGISATDERVIELVTHENFHRLNGHHLRFDADAEFETMWFREGVTDYVARRNAAAAGTLSRPAFFRFLGRALANYDAARERAGTQASAGFWSDRDLLRFPYDKGALLGALIDLRLREAGHDLEAFFAALRDANPGDLDNDAIRDALEVFSGQDWSAFWARWVETNEPLPIFARLEATGLSVIERVEPAPYFGFRTSTTVDGTWFISAVDPGSPAARAGLVSGVALSGEPYVPTSPLGGDARLRARTSTGERAVTIRSGRGQRRTFALTATDDSYLDAFGLR